MFKSIDIYIQFYFGIIFIVLVRLKRIVYICAI